MSPIDKVLNAAAAKLMLTDSLNMAEFAANWKQVNNDQK